MWSDDLCISVSNKIIFMRFIHHLSHSPFDQIIAFFTLFSFRIPNMAEMCTQSKNDEYIHRKDI